MNFLRFFILVLAIVFLQACSVYLGVKFALKNIASHIRVGFGVPFMPEDMNEEDDDSEEI